LHFLILNGSVRLQLSRTSTFLDLITPVGLDVQILAVVLELH
jgi:hypothetical protein